MKHVRSLISLALASALCLTMLTACGNADETTSSQQPSASEPAASDGTTYADTIVFSMTSTPTGTFFLNFGVPALVWTMFVRIFVIYILVSDCIWSAAVRRIRPDEFLFLKSCARLSLFLRGLPEAENGTGGPDESNGIQRTLKYV